MDIINKVYLIFDVSGSVDNIQKKYYENIMNYYEDKYKSWNVNIIKHTTIGTVCSRDLVLKGDNGGTYISSGFKIAVGDIIARRDYENSMIIMCNDGDNWSEDNEKLKALIEFCNDNNIKVIHHEILASTFTVPISKSKYFESVNVETYRVTDIKQDIFGNDKVIRVYYVEHEVGGKLYKFKSKDTLCIGDMAICETSKGNTYGKIVDVKMESDDDYKEIKNII